MLDAAAVRRVLAKELREARRDRNLILNVVLVPLFLYPILGFGMLQVMQVVRGIGERASTVIAVAGDVPGAVRDSLEAGQGALLLGAPPVVAGGGSEEFRRWREDIAAQDEAAPHALLVWTRGAYGDTARILHDGSRDRSRDARARIEDAIEAWRRERALAAFESAGLTETDLDRFRVESENTASAVQRGRDILAAGLPLVLLLMVCVATAATAIDTIVGERERGTLETLLVSPLARGDVLVGKYLFVVLAAFAAFTLNLLSMSLFVGWVLKLVDVGEDIRVSLDPLSILLVLGTAALLAAFLAAVFMILAVPSRTYREGQAALSPAYLLAMVPGLVVGASAEPFGMSQAVIPVLNATALFEAVLEGHIDAAPVAVTYLVLALSTAAALALAARIASREDVFLEPKLSLRELLRGGRTT
jgi:sodium transport system permease protein